MVVSKLLKSMRWVLVLLEVLSGREFQDFDAKLWMGSESWRSLSCNGKSDVFKVACISYLCPSECWRLWVWQTSKKSCQVVHCPKINLQCSYSAAWSGGAMLREVRELMLGVVEWRGER